MKRSGKISGVIGWMIPAVILAASPAWAQPAQPRIRNVPVRDAWVLQALEERIVDAIESGQFGGLAAQARNVLMARVRCGQLARAESLTEMVFLVRAAGYLPMAHHAGGKEFASWLWKNRPLIRVVFRAMGDTRDRVGSIDTLLKLYRADRNLLLRHPQLAAAICTAAPLIDDKHTPATSTLVETFKYYAGPAPFRNRVRDLPFEISRYIVDSRLSNAERKWAARLFIRHPNPVALFKDVPYDTEHAMKGKPKRLAAGDYTLPNIRKFGGTCEDQAWFAVQVAKAVGVPAAIVRGRNRDLTDATWTTGFKRIGRLTEWDTQSGCHPEQQYFLGTVLDAASRDEITHAELAMVTTTLTVKDLPHEQSDALAGIAMLVIALGKDPKAGDIEALKLLAVQYKKPRKHTGVRPRLETAWIHAAIALDAALAEDLLLAAIDKDNGNLRAWRLALKRVEDRKLSGKAINSLLTTVTRTLAREQIDYACQLLLTLSPAVNDPQKRDIVYRQALAALAKRPDLQGRLLTTIGDDYVAQNRKQAAEKLYLTAAGKCVNMGPVGVRAAQQLDSVYTDLNRTDLSLKLYTRMFALTRRAQASSPFYRQTPHFLIGRRLESLLRSMGRDREADQIRGRLEPPGQTPTGGGPRPPRINRPNRND